MNTRCGVTLLELLVTLVAIGLIAIATQLLVTTATSGASKAQELALTMNRNAMAKAQWRELLQHAIDFPADSGATPRFQGTPQSMRLRSWCRSSAGYRIPCIVQVAVVDRQAGSRIEIMAGELHQSIEMTGPVRLQYLDLSEGVGHWIHDWQDSPRLPHSIGVVGPRDTMALVLAR